MKKRLVILKSVLYEVNTEKPMLKPNSESRGKVQAGQNMVSVPRRAEILVIERVPSENTFFFTSSENPTTNQAKRRLKSAAKAILAGFL